VIAFDMIGHVYGEAGRRVRNTDYVPSSRRDGCVGRCAAHLRRSSVAGGENSRGIPATNEPARADTAGGLTATSVMQRIKTDTRAVENRRARAFATLGMANARQEQVTDELVDVRFAIYSQPGSSTHAQYHVLQISTCARATSLPMPSCERSKPTLVVWTTHDRRRVEVVSASPTRSDGRLVVIDNAATAAVEQADEFNALHLDFLLASLFTPKRVPKHRSSDTLKSSPRSERCAIARPRYNDEDISAIRSSLRWIRNCGRSGIGSRRFEPMQLRRL